MSGKHIFISYIEENRDIAEKIWDKLTEKGYIPWAYTKNDSSKWKKQIVRELQQCDIMILVFSKKTDEKANKQVVKELGLASEYEKEIIPFMLDDITPKDIKNEEIAYEIIGANITWINKEESLNKQIDILLNRIEKFYGGNDILGENKNTKLTTNEDPAKIDTLLLTREKGTNWSLSNNIKINDSLAFNIHYYGWYEGIKELRIKLTDINNRVFNKGDTIKIFAEVLSKNLQSSKGEVTIKFDDDVLLNLKHVSWQKNSCKSINCESTINDSIDNLFNNQGLYLGDIPKKDNNDYYGNLVVQYEVLPIIK